MMECCDLPGGPNRCADCPLDGTRVGGAASRDVPEQVLLASRAAFILGWTAARMSPNIAAATHSPEWARLSLPDEGKPVPERHSNFCPGEQHVHGAWCAVDCPTCAGGWSTRWRAQNGYDRKPEPCPGCNSGEAHMCGSY